jgi:hypothetical protein
MPAPIYWRNDSPLEIGFLPVYLSTCLPVATATFQEPCLTVSLFVSKALCKETLLGCLPVYLPTCRYSYVSRTLSNCLSVPKALCTETLLGCLPVYLPTCRYSYVSRNLPNCLSVCLQISV